MAVRKKKVTIKFELRQSALAGIGVVLCCLFLWTFIMGVWAGQSLLAPDVKRGKQKKEETKAAVSPAPQSKTAQSKKERQASKAKEKPKEREEEAEEPAAASSPQDTPQESAENFNDGSAPVRIRARRKVIKERE